MIVAEGSGIGDRSSSDSPVSALRMSASGHERTWETAIWTSAFGGKPDVDLASANVASSQKRSLETCKRRPVTQGDAVKKPGSASCFKQPGRQALGGPGPDRNDA